MSSYFEDRIFGEYQEREPARARSRPSPGKVSLTSRLPPRRSAPAQPVQRKANPDASESYGERVHTDDQWEDATAGLTQRQHGALSVALRWTGNIFQHAVPPRPQWQLLLDQCHMLEVDIVAMLGQCTTRAAASLAPALSGVNQTRGYIEGARQPEPEVRNKASLDMIAASSVLEQLVEHRVWVDDTGNVRVNSEDEVEALLDSSRPTPPEQQDDDGNKIKPSDRDIYPYMVNGTSVEIVSKAGEDEFRTAHKPLSDGQKSYAMKIKKLMVKDGLGFDDNKVSKLKDMEVSLRGTLMLFDDLMADGVGTKARLALERAKARVDKAHKMVVAKLATTLPDALGHVQRGAAQTESAIRATLALRPFKSDPEHGQDSDGDGQVDQRPDLDTRGLSNDDEVTRLVPEPAPLDHGDGSDGSTSGAAAGASMGVVSPAATSE